MRADTGTASAGPAKPARRQWLGDPPGPVLELGFRDYLIVFLIIAAIMAFTSTLIASQVGGISSMWFFWLLWPLLAGALALVMWTVRGMERLVRFRLRGLRFCLTLAVLSFATFALVKLHNDDQRCINKQNMTVVAAADCQNPGSQNPGSQVSPGQDVWYYGGSGTAIGKSVQGGSLTAPADDDNGGGAGSVGGGGDDDDSGSGSSGGGGGGGDDG